MSKISGPKQPTVPTPEMVNKAPPKASGAARQATTPQTPTLDTRHDAAPTQAPTATAVPTPTLQQPRTGKKKAVAGPPRLPGSDLQAKARALAAAYDQLPAGQQQAVQGAFHAFSRALGAGPSDLRATARTLANGFEGLSEAQQGSMRDVMRAFYAALDLAV